MNEWMNRTDKNILNLLIMNKKQCSTNVQIGGEWSGTYMWVEAIDDEDEYDRIVYDRWCDILTIFVIDDWTHESISMYWYLFECRNNCWHLRESARVREPFRMSI